MAQNCFSMRLTASVASNTGGPYTATWDRTIVPVQAVVRTVVAQARAVASNAIKSTVDVYRQTDSPAAGSNTATSILVTPITLLNDGSFARGVIRDSGVLLSQGDTLQLRTYVDTPGAKPAFLDLKVAIEVEEVG
jgi:hypothetical protein